MESRVSISDEEIFFLLGTQKNSGDHPSSYEAVTQGPLLRLKGMSCDAPYSFPFNAYIQSIAVHLQSIHVLMA
jgi:hypothetical protein